MTRLALFGITLLFVAGCLQETPDAPDEASQTLTVDPNRPDTEFGEVQTGPAVGPDLNATTAAPPRLIAGEWWRIRFSGTFYDDNTPVEVVRIVANVTDTGYIFGMPHEGWFKEVIAYHAPAFGDVDFNLAYNTHNVLFEPVRFPMKTGDTWETHFAAAPFIATVESADEITATIVLSPKNDPQPTDPITQAVALFPSGDVRLTYDARQHEVVKMESFIGTWEVVEHGYDFEGWTTVPRGEHTAIDYGVSFDGPSQGPSTRTVKVEGGFNRLTMMHVMGAIPVGSTGVAPGSFHIKSTTPNGTEFYTETTGANAFAIKFYEASDPDGDWVQEDFLGGPGFTYSMGIAYHQYDIRLPDGLRRSDHSHAVIR